MPDPARPSPSVPQARAVPQARGNVSPTFEISTDPDRLDMPRVHHWLSTDAYWATGRSREKHDRAVEDSLNFGVYDAISGEQLAYARAVTDLATFAWLCDVYVDRAVRGTGLGSALVDSMVEQLTGAGVRRIMLATEDAHGLYEKSGFTRVEAADKLMSLIVGQEGQ